jgi:hypothetical protein
LIQPGFGLRQFVVCSLQLVPAVPPTVSITTSLSDVQFLFNEVGQAVATRKVRLEEQHRAVDTIRSICVDHIIS